MAESQGIRQLNVMGFFMIAIGIAFGLYAMMASSALESIETNLTYIIMELFAVAMVIGGSVLVLAGSILVKK